MFFCGERWERHETKLLPIVTAPSRNNLIPAKEPRFNEPLYSAVLGIITNNIFFALVIIKCVGMNFDITKPLSLYSEQILFLQSWLH